MKKKITLDNVVDNLGITNNDKIGVGVSGGVDSMVLLSAILKLRETIQFDVVVVHINHQLRGIESDRDESFVKEFCEKNRIQFENKKVNVKQNKKDNKLTEEESARVLRYQEFNNVIEKYSLNKFFLAHHANDQAETVLMHIFRGSGTNGALGMLNGNKFYRPLLQLSRKEILSVAKGNNIEYVEDSTNSQNICNRNILRNSILPQIEEFYPNAASNICKFAENLSVDQEFIEANVPYNVVIKENNCAKFPLEILTKHKAISYRIIKYAFNQIGVFSDILSKHIDAILSMKDLMNGSKLNMPHEIVVVKEYDYISLYKPDENKLSVSVPFDEGTFDFNGNIIVVEKVSVKEVNHTIGQQFICVDNIDGAVWRYAKSNDVFQKLGAAGSKKLVDYFTDKKIPVMKRKSVPLLAQGNEILLVVGFDISDKVKIKDNSSKIVRVTCLTNLS